MTKRIHLEHITKIEGHANLNVKIEDGKVKKCSLNVVEGARFFEAIVRGRKYDEISILTSRICGVCSVIHAVTALNAIENAFNIKLSKQTQLLRELLVLGGTIQSHVMHLFFLALPDYKGYSSAIAMAEKNKKIISDALQLKSLGNDIVTIIGGRDIHPFTCIPGGFSRVPTLKEVNYLLKKLKSSRKKLIDTVKLFQKLRYPKFTRETQHYALTPDRYGFIGGKIMCAGKKCIPTFFYDQHFTQMIRVGSTAKFVVEEGKEYMVGALPRIHLNYNKLYPTAKRLVNWKIPTHSPYLNNVAQAIEMVQCAERCIEILSKHKFKKEKLPEIKPRVARGVAVNEAPRGMLFHDYTFNKEGYVKSADIITPTAQNLKNIELDIKELLPLLLKKKKSKEEIVLELEKLIRAYDPCISCAAHFLEVNWK